MKTLPLAGTTLYYTGPSLEEGPLPALFYFFTSGADSLTQPPSNEPVLALARHPLRIFSLTLPAHEEGLSPLDAIDAWAQAFARGDDPLAPFLDTAERVLTTLQAERLVTRVGVAGLSRGALAGAYLAARSPAILALLGFAPLTRLRFAREMHATPAAARYDIASLAPQLASKHIRFYIGNRDVRVSTRHCFECIETLVEAASAQHVRSAPIELIVTPSIGRDGHGTSAEIFQQGAAWIANLLSI